MTLDEFVQEAKRRKIGDGTVVIDARTYAFDILPASFQPAIPFFVGYPMDYLFISDEVPEQYRMAALAHEILCERFRLSGDHAHCERAVAEEMKYIPADADRDYYISLRLKMFDSLIEVYERDGQHDSARQMVAPRDAFKAMVGKRSIQ